MKPSMFSQRNINVYNKRNIFSFNVEGFKIKFLVTTLENEDLYMIKKVGEVGLPRCLDHLPAFINMKTINDILQISKYFGRNAVRIWNKVKSAGVKKSNTMTISMPRFLYTCIKIKLPIQPLVIVSVQNAVNI